MQVRGGDIRDKGRGGERKERERKEVKEREEGEQDEGKEEEGGVGCTRLSHRQL